MLVHLRLLLVVVADRRRRGFDGFGLGRRRSLNLLLLGECSFCREERTGEAFGVVFVACGNVLVVAVAVERLVCSEDLIPYTEEPVDDGADDG